MDFEIRYDEFSVKFVNVRMSILEQKIELAKKVLETDDLALLEQIKSLFEVNQKDFWDDLPEHMKESVKKGQQQAKDGVLTTHDEVMSKYQKYL